MARKEYEEDDPMILSGVALPGDTETAMTETFVEEFIKMGYADETILNLFTNPFFAIPHQVLQRRGEGFVRDVIARQRAVWGPIRYRVQDPEVNHGFSV